MNSRIADFDELLQHLERVVTTKHHNTGRWTTAQIFYHLAAAFEGSIDGLPAGYPAWVRVIIRPFRRLVTHVRFPPWLPIPAAAADKLTPPIDADVQQQYERFVRSIERFIAYDGELAPHPVLGSLTRSELTGFHLRHCQHHLRFIRFDDART